MSDDEATECLHCEINQLVQERVDQGGADLAELAAMIVESLVELVLLVPDADRAKLMADVLAHFGHTYLEKSGAMPSGSGATH